MTEPGLLFYVAAAVAGYLLGAIPFGLVLTRLAGLGDIREIGSGNIGATNVLRSGSKAAAILTLAGDAGKGWLAVWAVALLSASTLAAGLAALAVFLGHVFPLFHRFKGGKGVATAAGALFGLDWRIGLGTLATWLIIAAFLRYSSLAALIAAAFAPLATLFVLGTGARAAAVLAMSAILVWRHKENIARLVAGTEPRLGAKKQAT